LWLQEWLQPNKSLAKAPSRIPVVHGSSNIMDKKERIRTDQKLGEEKTIHTCTVRWVTMRTKLYLSSAVAGSTKIGIKQILESRVDKMYISEPVLVFRGKRISQPIEHRTTCPSSVPLRNDFDKAYHCA
jgi:hypothetical protein